MPTVPVCVDNYLAPWYHNIVQLARLKLHSMLLHVNNCHLVFILQHTLLNI